MAWLYHSRRDCLLGSCRVAVLMTRAIVIAALVILAKSIPIAGAKAAHDAAQYVEVK